MPVGGPIAGSTHGTLVGTVCGPKQGVNEFPPATAGAAATTPQPKVNNAATRSFLIRSTSPFHGVQQWALCAWSVLPPTALLNQACTSSEGGRAPALGAS